MEKRFITGYRHYYSLLPAPMQKTYTAILDKLTDRRMDFYFPIEEHDGASPTTDMIFKIYDYVLLDNPLIYHVNRANAKFYSYASSGCGRITYNDFYSPSQRYMIKQQIYRRAEQILDFLSKQPDQYAMLHELYRYIVATLKYDRSFSAVKTQKNLEALTIVAPLLRNTGVCAGYSQLFKFLCDQLGINCFELIGPAYGRNGWGLHCWNVVNLDGKFYHVDATFDSGHFHATKRYDYEHFLRSDEAMQKNHKWDRNSTPVMANDFDMQRAAVS